MLGTYLSLYSPGLPHHCPSQDDHLLVILVVRPQGTRMLISNPTLLESESIPEDSETNVSGRMIKDDTMAKDLKQ